MIARRVLAVPSTSMPSELIFSAAVLLINKLRKRLSSDIVDSLIFKTKTVFIRILRKMQRKAILPMLLECILKLNTSTCMQYAASFVAVKRQFSNQIFGDMHVNIFFSICRMFHFCITAEAFPLLLQKSIDATMWSEILQYGLTYTMQTWSHIYDAIRCEPSDVSGYLIRTSGCLIWHDLTTLLRTHITRQNKKRNT